MARSTRSTATLVAVPLLALALAGCAAGAPSAASATKHTGTKTPAASPSETFDPSATPSPSASGKVDPNAPQGQCADDAMQVAVTADQAGGGAGSVGYDVTITNSGSVQCVLDGYPGVSVVGGGNGSQLGPAADRTGDSPKPVTLAPGGAVTAVMEVVNIGTSGGALTGCTSVAGDGWRVYPPHSYRAYFVADPSVRACKNGPVWMHLTSGVKQTS